MKGPKIYVVTGGSCSGKTTLLSELSKRGYRTFPEAARVLIDKGISEGKTLEEIRRDEIDFQKKVLKMKLELEDKLKEDEVVFLDRGVPDTIAYYKLYNFDFSDLLRICKKKRYEKIFFLEPLIFEKDYARIEDKETTRKLSDLIKRVYLDLGYEVITVPVMSVEQRAKFVLSKL